MDVARERSETSGPHRDGAMQTLLAAMASISLLVGGIGIMNILLVSVTERTR
jgi:ABC-type antimicrobial peptide transport system permease subunit